MSKKVKIFGLKALPIWLVVVALVAAGAGAAVGTVLTGKVVGDMPVTISQALEVGKPVIHTGVLTEDTHVDNMPQSVDALDGVIESTPDVDASYVVAPDRSIGAVNDEQTGFQFAAEIDQHDFYIFYVPLKNASNQDMVVEISMVVPEGLSVEVMDTASGGNYVDNVVRTGWNTWKFDLEHEADKQSAEEAIYIVVAASDTIAPGYYTIVGEIVQISY